MIDLFILQTDITRQADDVFRQIFAGLEAPRPVNGLLTRGIKTRATFDPAFAKALVTTFENSRDQLAPSDLSNPLMVEFVAKLIILFAEQGERSPERLNKLVPAAIGG